MPNSNKKLRMDALFREQKFVDIPKPERLNEDRMKRYVELFTEKLIHQQKKIHLLLTDMFIQELKIIHLFQKEKYHVVVTTSILNPGSQKCLPTAYNAKYKVQARDILKYFKTLGIKATWDEVNFLIRRFLYESPYFSVPRPLRWDWKDYENTDGDETHFESDDMQFPTSRRKMSDISSRTIAKSEKKHPHMRRYHPYEENQKKNYKAFMDDKKRKKPQSSHRGTRETNLENFNFPEFPKDEKKGPKSSIKFARNLAMNNFANQKKPKPHVSQRSKSAIKKQDFSKPAIDPKLLEMELNFLTTMMRQNKILTNKTRPRGRKSSTFASSTKPKLTHKSMGTRGSGRVKKSNSKNISGYELSPGVRSQLEDYI